MSINKPDFIGIDLFAGAGGLSLGAELANIDVVLAIEKDKYAAETYIFNHPKTQVINDDIQNIKKIHIGFTDKQTILFGGPPCQGFSYSNQRTRNEYNPSNWLLNDFIRISDILMPDWIVFENVQGFINTKGNLFLYSVLNGFEKRGYKCVWYVLNAVDYGVPQRRSRFFLICSKRGYKVSIPTPHKNDVISVYKAIADLPSLSNGSTEDYLKYKSNVVSDYSALLRKDMDGCTGHLVTKNSIQVIERYKYIPQGGNWKNIPIELMKNYFDRTRCHTGIYHRLDQGEPALTIGNYRKAMLIHPWEDRGLSVREAARLQSFPDWYEFKGPIGFQQQQVGNAVPPLLAKAVFDNITNGDYVK